MVLLTIIANCIVLALEEHLPYEDKTTLARSLVGIRDILEISNRTRCPSLGENGNLFYWNLLFRSSFKNYCIRICITSSFVPSKSLECNGFCCRRHWVCERTFIAN